MSILEGSKNEIEKGREGRGDRLKVYPPFSRCLPVNGHTPITITRCALDKRILDRTLDAMGPDLYDENVNKSSSPDPFPPSRRSVSAEASRVAELARLRSMTVEERIRLALSLKQQLTGFKPAQAGAVNGCG